MPYFAFQFKQQKRKKNNQMRANTWRSQRQIVKRALDVRLEKPANVYHPENWSHAQAWEVAKNKVSIALINTAIQIKANTFKVDTTGFNFYQWLKEARDKTQPNETLKGFWAKICLAGCTELRCRNFFTEKVN